MPGQRNFWVIVTGTTATAFRSLIREDLLPSLKQLQRTEPDAVVKWFERNKLWDSPEQAEEARRVRERPRTGRGRDWRPGGNHVDPRLKYQVTRDQKRARFKRRLIETSRPEGGSRGVVRRPKKKPDEE